LVYASLVHYLSFLQPRLSRGFLLLRSLEPTKILTTHDRQLDVNVDGDEFIVTLPGTRLNVTFQKSPGGGPFLIETSNYVTDPDAPMTAYQFVPLARHGQGKTVGLEV
jgi:hypothetical protein